MPNFSYLRKTSGGRISAPSVGARVNPRPQFFNFLARLCPGSTSVFGTSFSTSFSQTQCKFQPKVFQGQVTSFGQVNSCSKTFKSASQLYYLWNRYLTEWSIRVMIPTKCLSFFNIRDRRSGQFCDLSIQVWMNRIYPYLQVYSFNTLTKMF